ncbi:MAG TPA: AI-2E family transporter, partial [Solirubrobacteraceae bacterium]|nr:AI-2E family transporter [Solirubrobacteraceae bacterium]
IGAVWLLAKTSSIVDPLIAGFVIGAVSGALVDRLERRGWPRGAGAGVVMVGLIALGLLVVALVLGGISSQGAHIDASMTKALDRVQGWAQDLGITAAPDAASEIKQAVPAVGHTLLNGVAKGISGLASLLVFLGFTAFTTFFLIKDGPAIGRWIERHMGMQPAEASIVLGDVIQALRRYFLGLTIIAALSTAAIVLGALIVGLPLLGTIAIVTFIASYVPIMGAWTAGIFVFALALANQGTTAALIMAAIVFLANGPLQQIVQPVVYGATLRLNPLVVFSVTIGAGALFGMVGMILAAPLVSAAVRIHDDLADLRTAPAGDGTIPAGREGVTVDVLHQT